MSTTFEKRLENGRALLEKFSIELLLITSQGAINYFTDLIDIPGYLIIGKDSAIFYTDPRFTQELSKIAAIYDGRIFSGNILPYLKDAGFVKDSRIGVQKQVVNAEFYDSLFKLTGRKAIIDISVDIRQLLNTHDKESLKRMKKAIDIAEEAFFTALDKLEPGVTEIDIAAELSYQIRTGGGNGDAFPPIVAFGKNSAKPHAIPTKNKLKNDDLVLIDWGCYYQGVYSDCTRICSLGHYHPKGFEVVNDCIDEVISSVFPLIKAGCETGLLSQAAQDIMKQFSYKGKQLSEYFPHALGHGIGYEIHALPIISTAYSWTLWEGSVVTIEPGIYIPGIFGVRKENMFLVGDDSSQLLTGF
ncbi:MAG: Xaa-Pro peptidase family protein [Ignavibacteria bacterium]|nr:Xaa-Pro peptidase family protein [Ignavibacteria bacterium]